MLKNNFGHKKAFQLAVEGFSNYMAEYYNLILEDTQPYSQKRFDKFRKHYAKVASRIPYMQIIHSSKNILKARFKRCPFSEVMKHYRLKGFSYAFCLSDPAFTKKVLPGVKFRRKSLISKGGRYCDNTWIFKEN